jgi:two-component system chemotaxis response regulator CheB
VAIGASTGGPGACAEILRRLPESLSAPILLVLHISEPFGAELARWLDSQSSHQVRYARQDERLADLTGVVMAPPGQHLRVRRGRLLLTQEQERHSCRPSVDVMFESLAEEEGPQTVGCLLTGMGKDGALGLLALRRAGALTVAQNEATCVVYGMPREAAMLGAAELILPLADIPAALARAVTPAERPQR